MEKTIRANETSKMLRIDDTYSEIFALESALLKGDKLRANVRCRIARETKNPEILRLCIQDSAITVVVAAKENPILTSEMKLEISKIEKAWAQSKQDKNQEETKQIQVPTKDNQCKDKKTNWWAIVSLLLFFTLCVLSYCLYESYERIDSLYWQRNNSENTVYEVNAELQAKEQEISTLQEQLQSKIATINSLQNQLPQTYYTKYTNQAIYYWDGSFIKAGSYWPDSDVCVTIYLQKEGYGMTEFGWVPMNCLRK